MNNLCTLGQCEIKVDVSRWKIMYAIRYHGVCKDRPKIGNTHYFTKENIRELKEYFNNKEGGRANG